MSLTYGSFGDIITTVQLANQLLQALSESHGSARQFRDLVIELRVFHRVLDHASLAGRLECVQLTHNKTLLVTALLADTEARSRS